MPEAKSPFGKSSLGLVVSDVGVNAAARIPGEEAVDAAVLRRDDDLGRLIDRVFGGNSAGRVAEDIGFLQIVSADRQAAKTVCESDAANADRLDAQAWEIGIMA